MDGLRSVNKRRRAFRAQPMKASRRKFANGGMLPNPYEETYDKTVSSLARTSSTDDDTRSALSGDMVERTDMPRGGGYAGGGHIPPGGDNKQHPVGKALGRVPSGLKGYQEGGEVDEEEDLYRSPGGVKAVKPPAPARYGMAPLPVAEAAATAGLREPPPPPPEIRSPEEREPIGRSFEGAPGGMIERNIEARQAANLAAAGRTPAASAPAYTSDAEAAARGGRPLAPVTPTPDATGKMLGYFGLREASTKATPVESAPGVTKYRDPATGKTLYANTTNIGAMAPTPEMVKEAQGRAKADSDRLTGLVAARAASGDPRDIEAARQLAVTPEQRMLVADAENVASLRSRAAGRGIEARVAAMELQGRQAQQLEGLRGQRALQTAMLGRVPTPLELERLDLDRKAAARAERGEARAATQEQRTNNLKLINDTIEGNFTPDDRGKAEAADFRQNLTATLPHIKGTGGDLSKINPDTLAILFSLNALRKNASPGSISQFFGADPSSKNLLDFVPKSPAAGFWRTQIRTPQGVNTLGELAGGRKDLKDFIARVLAEQGVDGG